MAGFSCFVLKTYVLIWKAKLETERETEGALPSADSLPRVGLPETRTWSFFQVSYVSAGGPSAWTILHCFPRHIIKHIIKKLDGKWRAKGPLPPGPDSLLAHSWGACIPEGCLHWIHWIPTPHYIPALSHDTGAVYLSFPHTLCFPLSSISGSFLFPVIGC